MKKVLLLFMGMGILSFAFAQQSNQPVISPAGNSDEISTISLEWTLGELAVQSLDYPAGMLTQGFHQPTLIIKEVLEAPQSSLGDHLNVTVAPNPTRGSLYIKIDSDLEKTITLSLKTMEGSPFRKATLNLPQGEFEWNLQDIPVGLYLLTIHTPKGDLLKSFKITKIN